VDPAIDTSDQALDRRVRGKLDDLPPAADQRDRGMQVFAILQILVASAWSSKFRLEKVVVEPIGLE